MFIQSGAPAEPGPADHQSPLRARAYSDDPQPPVVLFGSEPAPRFRAAGHQRRRHTHTGAARAMRAFERWQLLGGRRDRAVANSSIGLRCCRQRPALHHLLAPDGRGIAARSQDRQHPLRDGRRRRDCRTPVALTPCGTDWRRTRRSHPPSEGQCHRRLRLAEPLVSRNAPTTPCGRPAVFGQVANGVCALVSAALIGRVRTRRCRPVC